MRLAFWAAFALSAYVYFGYPALLTLVRRRPPVGDLPDGRLPTVALVIAAHDEEAVIAEKLSNSLAIDYPPDKLSIVVASDGSTDRTNAIVRSFSGSRIRLEEMTPRGGKTRALNAVVPRTHGEITVLSDANTMFRPDAIRKLVRHFADPRVGCVSGDVRLIGSAEEYADSEGAYYRYERFIQQQESALGAIIGADGGMYALRHALFRRVPDDVVVDDFVISMNVARDGFAVRYEPEAVAIEQGTLSAREEFRRKVRVIAGGIQALTRGVGVPRWFQVVLLWCYVSHKLLRWFMPAALVVLFVTSMFLAADDVFAMVFALQVVFYAAALVHRPLLRRGVNLRVTSVPYYFCLVNAAAGVGIVRGLTGRQRSAWSRTRREHPDTPAAKTAGSS
jgi:cellulose synthase/poly-beta-1,6-N-acetylglucosamine synthase-like glycosyltransferase